MNPDPLVLCMLAKSTFDKLSRIEAMFHLGFVTDPVVNARLHPSP